MVGIGGLLRLARRSPVVGDRGHARAGRACGTNLPGQSCARDGASRVSLAVHTATPLLPEPQVPQSAPSHGDARSHIPQAGPRPRPRSRRQGPRQPREAGTAPSASPTTTTRRRRQLPRRYAVPRVRHPPSPTPPSISGPSSVALSCSSPSPPPQQLPCPNPRPSAPPSAEASETEATSAATTTGGRSSSSVLSFLCPLLKFLGGGDPSQERNDIVEVTTSSLSSLARLPWGSSVATSSGENINAAMSAPTLQLGMPFCRRVREAMTELDLSAEVYPCPKGSLRHRDVVKKIGGKEQFPLLVDATTGVTIYESGDIVKYLCRLYGQGKHPSFGLLESTIFTGWVPTLLRAGRGMTLWSKAGVVPAEKLELFSFENNTYARIVREALCELELPYVLQNVGDGSLKMDLLLRISGSKQVPYLIDPNTGFKSGDHKKILSYLFQQYSISS